MDKQLLEKLKAILPDGCIKENAPMSKYTSFRCGGNADLIIVDTVDQLLSCTKVIKESGARSIVIGNGSNTLFEDGEHELLVIKLGKDFSEITVDGENMICGTAALLPYAANVAAANSLGGMEALSGIPGSIGGALYMNAGAYDHCIADVVSFVDVLSEDGELLRYDANELELSYRHSRFEGKKDIILYAGFKLCRADQSEIEAAMKSYTARRKEKQPLSMPSAGSFFKRPNGAFAAALIDQAGLKGRQIGGAMVSPLHAGFLVNADNASASEVLSLADEVIKTVKEKSGIELEPEVRIIRK